MSAMGLADDFDFDPVALQQKYDEERDKRRALRPEGLAQFRSLTGELERYAEDPYTPVEERDPRQVDVDVVVVGGGFAGMLAGALALALGLAGVLAVVLGGPNKTSADRRLEAYFGDKGADGKGKSSSSADLRGSAVALTDKVVSADLETRVSQRLAGAGSALTAAEWLLLHAGIAIGTAVLAFVFKGPGFAVFGLIVGVIDVISAIVSPSDRGRGWDITIGVISMLAGGFLLVYTDASLRVLVVFVGIWLILAGALATIAAFRLRSARIDTW